MKHSVHDDLVAEYAKRLRSGGHLGQVFPQPPSECDFTEAQKLLIQEAKKFQKERRKKLKLQQTALLQTSSAPVVPKPTPASQPKPISPPAKVAHPKPVAPVPATKAASLTKLEKMLFLQHGKCFFCGETLTLAEANIEHLYPLSKGGKREADNEVVCHKTLNETFGNMPLKGKFEFVLNHSGSFRCPKK
jgi:hypothetical protein